MMIRNFFVTPTCILVGPSNWVMTNKVLRSYRKFKQFFVRLHFVSDQMRRDFYFGDYNQLKMGHVHGFLENGIKILGNRYRFLCYSNSQLKEHSAWFLMDNGQMNLNQEQIYMSMGHVAEETTLSKRLSRFGQHFTTSKNTGTLDEEQV